MITFKLKRKVRESHAKEQGPDEFETRAPRQRKDAYSPDIQISLKTVRAHFFETLTRVSPS